MQSPFHRGEQEVQSRVGVLAAAEKLGQRLINDAMPDQHRVFFEQLPLLFVGSIDGAGRPWASVVVGEPGFARSPAPRSLVVGSTLLPHDPLAENLQLGAGLGILGLEYPTRRRNRVNGKVVRLLEGEFELEVVQSFGNCPGYIQKRTLSPRADATSELSQGVGLNSYTRELIEKSDTFFIASAFDEHGVDMSHRGGKPGFVKVEGDGVLVFPDFSGNNLFNTLGNLLANPRAGLLFLDYETGDVLYLTGRSEIVWDGPEVEAFEGARRLVKVEVEEWRLVVNSLPFHFVLEEFSPSLRRTGSWRE